MHYNTVFQQLFNLIPRHRFEKSVEILGGDRYCKHFSAWKQCLTLLYAQITGKDSLREIETGLLANQKNLYHLGMEAAPTMLKPVATFEITSCNRLALLEVLSLERKVIEKPPNWNCSDGQKELFPDLYTDFINEHYCGITNLSVQREKFI